MRRWNRLLRVHRAVAGVALPLALFSVSTARGDQMILKTEMFDTDPSWDSHNNRATSPGPTQITQNFGFSNTTHAGGPAGEIGGQVTPAGEPAWYAMSLPTPLTFNDALSMSGKFNNDGGGHTLFGFFNSNTAKEWRTPNSMVFRIYGRGDHFEAYPEYGTSKWRVGSGGFPTFTLGTGGTAIHTFSLQYDPNANSGAGMITAQIDDKVSVVNLSPALRADGASFNHFGILNVMKSADGAGRFWFDNVTVNGQLQNFNTNPNWDHLNNQTTYSSTNVRPRFDFGYSTSHFAGGKAGGEIGGQIFRGDSRTQFNGQYMAFYGARLDQTLNLQQPLRAGGKVSFDRGVSDSTTLIGFFHHGDSVRNSDAQNSAIPEDFVGAAIEGPSAEGFFFYPAYGLDVEGIRYNGDRGDHPPYIYPDGTDHDWTLDYDPAGGNGLGTIKLTLDGLPVTLTMDPGHKNMGAHFDRFGIITTQIDGSGQTVYFDDLTYTTGFQVPEPSASLALLGAGVTLVVRRRARLGNA